MDHLTDSLRYSFNGISWSNDSDSRIDLIKFLAMLNVKAAQTQYNAYRAGAPFRINWCNNYLNDDTGNSTITWNIDE